MVDDWANAVKGRHAAALRYFNPVGADVSGEIGEDPNGTPSNLMPFISQVAVGRQKALSVFGDDYDTLDGTGVRDYIHVTDLAIAHIAALENIEELGAFDAINIGTGIGLSVFQILKEFETQAERTIEFQICPRRHGDASAVWADVSKAAKKLGFKATRGIAEMCSDSWRWQVLNPDGYR